MITNDVQYRSARAQADRLEMLADELATRPISSDDGGLRRELEVTTVESQLGELRAQLAEYDALREGRSPVGELSSLDDLPRLLVRARIASGMSQRTLAERLGLKQQQIQRYEASDYSSASLSRLREVAAAVGLTDAYLPSKEVSGGELMNELVTLGLDPTFVRRRIAPASLRDRKKGQSSLAPVIDLASRVGRVFGVDASNLLAGGKLEADSRVLAAANFKMPKGTTLERVAAYTVYAHYLTLLVEQATGNLVHEVVPSDAAAFRAMWQTTVPGHGFEELLQFVWKLGIPVLPLADSGGFHAAVWNVHGREVIVLKQGARNSSRWAFDLLHEIAHILAGLDGIDRGVVDGDEMSVEDGEQEANQFAGDVLLDGRAEELVQRCVDLAKGSVERLKQVVPRVASDEGVGTDNLANYMAFRLSMQGINWWGAATNMQRVEDDPWSTCRDALVRHADLGSLNPLDRELINQALVR